MNSFFVVNASNPSQSGAQIKVAVETAAQKRTPLIVVIHGGLVEPGSFAPTEKALAKEFARRNLTGLSLRWDSGFWQTASRLMQRLHQHPFVQWAIPMLLTDSWGLVTFSESETVILARRLAERLEWDEEFQAVWRAARRKRSVKMDPPNLEVHPEFGFNPTFFVAWGLVSCGLAIRKRMANNTHHGMHATTVEELLRIFFLGEMGKLGWEELKHSAQSAGTCTGLMEGLAQSQVPVGILAHSAGAIVGLHLVSSLTEACESSRKPRLALFAPAISVRAAQSFSRFTKESMIVGLSDEVELSDSAFPLYPASILCLLSAIFESKPCEPILGMQRSPKGRWESAEYLWSGADSKEQPQNHRGMLHPILPNGLSNHALDVALQFLTSGCPEPTP